MSLVRNNDKKSIGYLKIPNRVYVALSRAKRGLFMLGNIEMLADSESPLWLHVQKVLIQNGRLSNDLILPFDHTHQATVIEQPMIEAARERVCTVLSKATSGVTQSSTDRNLDLGPMVNEMLHPRYLKKKMCLSCFLLIFF